MLSKVMSHSHVDLFEIHCNTSSNSAKPADKLHPLQHVCGKCIMSKTQEVT